MKDNILTKDAIVIERIFNAPTELIWKLWTESEHFKNWYGPKGVKVPIAEMDVRIGGRRFVCMEMQTSKGSIKMWFTGEYLEVIPNQRLVYTDSMADENGNVLASSTLGMPENYPEISQVTVVLEELTGRTKMTMTHAGIAEKSGATGGWEQAFSKMAERIEMVLHD